MIENRLSSDDSNVRLHYVRESKISKIIEASFVVHHCDFLHYITEPQDQDGGASDNWGYFRVARFVVNTVPLPNIRDLDFCIRM
jgi:hypothetical protein